MMEKMRFWDRHLELKHPEIMQPLKEGIGETFRNQLAKRDLNADDPRTYKVIEANFRRMELEHYGQFDLTILDELGLSLSEILDLVATKRKRKKAAAPRPSLSEAEEKFVEIVVECEAKGMSHAETIRALRDEIRHPGEQTLRNWLKDLCQSPHCEIPAPRPKNVKG